MSAPKAATSRARSSCVAVEQMPVEHQHVVTGSLERRLGVGQFERQMRLTAAEIDAAVESPARVDQRDLMRARAASGACRRARRPPASPVTQAARSAIPSRQPTRARQPHRLGQRGAYRRRSRAGRRARQPSCRHSTLRPVWRAISSSTTRRLTAFAGPPPRLKARPADPVDRGQVPRDRRRLRRSRAGCHAPACRRHRG